MGVATVALIDTDSDPDTVDLPIPGNDDSIRSIELMLAKLADAVLEGRAALPPEQQAQPRLWCARGPSAPPPVNPKLLAGGHRVEYYPWPGAQRWTETTTRKDYRRRRDFAALSISCATGPAAR